MTRARKILIAAITGSLLFIAGGAALVVFAGAPRPDPEIRTMREAPVAVGLHSRVTQKDVFKKLPALYSRYLDLKGKGAIENIAEPWEYISVSRDFESDGSWDYYTGHVVSKPASLADGLVAFSYPTGEYAVFKLRRSSKWLFPLRMAQLKGFVYDRWLPSSGYSFSGVEFEYNNAEMSEKSPYDIDLFVGIKKERE